MIVASGLGHIPPLRCTIADSCKWEVSLRACRHVATVTAVLTTIVAVDVARSEAIATSLSFSWGIHCMIAKTVVHG